MLYLKLKILGPMESAIRSPKSEMESAVIFDIQRYSIHDGPGIRTLIFFKGCPLACRWCQNPESLDPAPEIGVYPDKCIGCGECTTACPSGAVEKGRIDRESCERCGVCTEVCPAESLRLIGRSHGAEELLEEALRDEPFYKSSGGGVTVSGGEPMLHDRFLEKFLGLCKAAGLHTCMETCGRFTYKKIEPLLPLLDLILYDIKAVDEGLHKEWTGAGNRRILENFERLLGAGKELVPRLPYVPGHTARRENLEAVARFLGERGIGEVRLLPYHSMGESKIPRIASRRLSPLSLRGPSREELEEAVRLFESFGVRAVVGG